MGDKRLRKKGERRAQLTIYHRGFSGKGGQTYDEIKHMRKHSETKVSRARRASENAELLYPVTQKEIQPQVLENRQGEKGKHKINKINKKAY